MPSTIHEVAIQQILTDHPDAKTSLFMRSVNGLLEDNGDLPVEGYRIIPDAYRIDHEQETVFAFEVEGSHKITDHKMENYISLAWALDEIYWALVVIATTRWGSQETVRPLDFELQRIAMTARKDGQDWRNTVAVLKKRFLIA